MSRTDRQTDRQNYYIYIARQQQYADARLKLEECIISHTSSWSITIAYFLEKLLSCKNLSAIVKVCSNNKLSQFAVVRRRQTCFASIYCTSPIFVTFLIFPITYKFIISIQKTTFAFITQNFHVNSRHRYVDRDRYFR